MLNLNKLLLEFGSFAGVLAYFGVLLTEIRGSFSITLCFDFCGKYFGLTLAGKTKSLREIRGSALQN